jgi:hypothetical protein
MCEIVEYDIQSWTPDAIVLRRDFPCAIELFTIDLNTKAVSGAGHRINENDLFCKSPSKSQNEEGTWTYRLTGPVPYRERGLMFRFSIGRTF